MDDVLCKKHSLCLRGVLFDLSEPVVMGIMNYTYDSFYDGGKYSDPGAVLSQVGRMIAEGAGIIDIGAVSSRPGADIIKPDKEIKRLSEVVGLIRKKYPDIIISVDTYRSEVARIMVKEFEVDLINDISSGTLDERMPETIAELQVPYILMHMQGTPQTMQKNPQYEDVVNDIIKYFAERIHFMRCLGINDLIIDPGFGFGKTIGHNYTLAGRLEELSVLDLPLLVGFSRKSMIYKTLVVTPDKALAGTIALNTIALIKGADIIRVHDVREASDVIRIISRLNDLSGKSL